MTKLLQCVVLLQYLIPWKSKICEIWNDWSGSTCFSSFQPKCVSDLQDEWKTFRNYLKVQASKQECPNCKTCIAETGFSRGWSCRCLSSLSIVLKIILVCPLGTASVERSFSIMGRISNRHQRMLPENLAHCMRISAEGPNTLTAEQSEEIVRKWHSRRDDRRIRIWLYCCLYYKMKILPYWLFCVL